MSTSLCSTPALVVLALFMFLVQAVSPSDYIPADSKIAGHRRDMSLVMLNPLEIPGDIQLGGWRIDALIAKPSEELPPTPAGVYSLKLSGRATVEHGKADCPLARPSGDLRWAGIWVYLPQSSNVKEIAFQFQDKEGEALILTQPANWNGWRWVEFDLYDSAAKQAYPQKDKNGKLDAPVSSLHLVWVTEKEGEFNLKVDNLLGLSNIPKESAAMDCRLSVPSTVISGSPLDITAVIHNFTDQTVECEISLTVQEDRLFFSEPPPDPCYGINHAARKLSWVEHDGKRIDDNSLTNPDSFEGYATPWVNNHYKEASQFIDLGAVRDISHIVYNSGDANWVWLLDLDASDDGAEYKAVPGVTGFNLHGRHGRTVLPIAKPFRTRFLRLRYHTGGESKPIIRMGRSLQVYDGTMPDGFPKVGGVVGESTVKVQVPARSPALVALRPAEKLADGAYFIGIHTQIGEDAKIFYEHCSAFAPVKSDSPAFDSPFGINCGDMSLAGAMRELGMGWVRFENMKWPMCSPEPNVYRFDGTVQPWAVNHDRIFKTYHENGLQILSYLFQVPSALSSAPSNVQGSRRQCYPPKDLSLYGQFVFQVAARYGRTKHPPEALLTPDKVSGMGLFRIAELWNEPNLDNPQWGHWVGPLSEYYEMFRHGAEAAKKADPSILVSHAGFAGMTFELVDTLRRHRYADGKTPLDFCDIINVHYYSGRVAPEIASVDTNVQREDGAKGERLFEDDLFELVEWRDMYRPQAQIWLTETGYDTLGPKGVGERMQAALIPRVVMLQLAAGIDKVFIYREKGSKPVYYGASGLIRENNTRKPSFATVGTMVKMLNGLERGGGLRLPSSDPNVILTLWKVAGKEVFTAWTVEGQAGIGLELGDCTVTDSFGRKSKARIGPDYVVNEFPVYFEGFGNAPAVRTLAEKAKRQHEERRAQRQAMLKRRALLFDFGSRDQKHVGVSRDLGAPRWFTPVVAEDVFSGEAGFGFTPGPAARNQETNWVKDRIQRDSVRMEPGTSFSFSVPAGTYELRLLAESTVAWQLGISGTSEEKTLDCTPGRREVATEIKLTKPGTLSIGTNKGLLLYSLSVIEKP